MDEQKIAQIFKALADENRIHVLKLLRDGEKCACKLLEALSISQPTLSHHMTILCDAGIVVGRKEGKWMYYRISCEGAATVRDLLQALTSPQNKPANCRCQDET